MFHKSINKKIKIVLVVIFFLFILIVFKVGYIQLFQYNKLNKLAKDLWSRNLPIEANRGKIYDRNGKVLADNLTTTSLVLIPNQIQDKDKVSKSLASILGVSKEEMDKHVKKSTSIERVHPEGRRLSYEIADKINSLNYDGVYLVKESKRFYPNSNYLAHVLGFVGIDNQGLSGLELEYDEYLTGSSGAIKYFSDAKGNRLQMAEVYEKPQDGMNMMLTINYDIQESIERELDNVVKKYNPEKALIVAMDPNTGEILGMSSRPSFDPNNYQNYTLEETSRNLPIWATYEPGSTFKIITLAAALEEGKVDLDKQTFYDGGSVQVENARIKCWKAGGHGHQTFLEVVQNSCNPGFVELGQRLGKDTLFSYINKFGFGSKTGIDLNGESSGIMFSMDRVGPVELATTAFGQGVSVTPIQQITAVSAAINGGKLVTPYIVKGFMEPETNTIVEERTTNVKRQIISKETSDKVRYALEHVVSLGSGRNAYIDGYRVGGKTGTAQKVQNGVYMVGNYIVSFIGFMPADDPQIILYVAVDNPKGVVQYGGTVAAPIARNILIDTIDILGIDKRDTQIEKNYNWNDKKYYLVPNVIGLTVKEAQEELKYFQIEYSGKGENIVEQSPKAGERILEGEKVRLLLTE